MATTKTTATGNRPSHELSFIEERSVDTHLQALLGRTVPANAVERIAHKAGVAFTTVRGNLNVYVGKKGDPAQKRYLVSFSKYSARRADIFEAGSNGQFDFATSVGEVKPLGNGSYKLLISVGRETLRYELHALPPPRVVDEPYVQDGLDAEIYRELEAEWAARAAAKAPTKNPAELDEHILRMDAIRREEAAAAAEAISATVEAVTDEERATHSARDVRKVQALRGIDAVLHIRARAQEEANPKPATPAIRRNENADERAQRMRARLQHRSAAL
jgi:hypothetical protein